MPGEEATQLLKADYLKMSGMIMRQPPQFEEVCAQLEKLGNRLNSE